MEKSGGELSSDTFDELARVPVDSALDVLGHARRRELLFALLDQDPRADSPAVRVAPADDPDALGDPVSMIHAHLPKLAEYGFITWNRDAHEITKGPDFDEIRPLLELLVEHEDELPEGWS